MGIFSTKKKVYVSSVAYNMAGDFIDRTSYLKTLVITSALNESDSIGRDVVDGYIHGPGISQRAFYRWSKAHFPLGTCQGTVNQAVAVPSGPLTSEIPVAPGESIEVKTAFVDMGDIFYWGERWMLEFRPDEYPDDWVAEYDTTTGEMVLTFPVGPEERVSYPTFSSTKKYIFAYYTRTLVDLSTVQSLFIYELGTGNADLDELDVEVGLSPEIFPVIPLRLDNKPIGDPLFAADYPAYAKAYKKATGGKISDVLASIEDNDNVGDIDYVFLVHGVELNTPEKCGQHYLYQFFKSLIPDQKTTPVEFANWLFLSNGYDTAKEALDAWTAAQLDPENPLYDTPKPTVPLRSELEVTRFEVKTTSDLNYQTNLGWVTIDENVHSGLGRSGAQKGDFWTEIETDIVFPAVPITGGTGGAWTVHVGDGKVSRFKLYWQDDDDSYRVLNIYGMFHENFVYAGKTVVITAREALEDADVSGFVVPLHFPTLHDMPLVLSTQLALSSRILIFNCYQIVKIRWYQRGIFKLIFSVILAVAIAVFFPEAAGLLGTALGVGSALGFVGLTAVIVGAVANTLAAMVLSTIIQKGAVALFGEKLGAIIGAIASFLAMSYVTGLTSGVPMTLNISEMMKAENLLKMMDVFTGAVTGWAQAKIGDIQDQMTSAFDTYKKDKKEIEAKALAEFGYGAAGINPLMFADMDGSFSSGQSSSSTRLAQPESPTTFLTRTLLTGNDIVEMSLAMVRKYPEIALELPTPYT